MKVRQEINWNADNDWALYVKYKLQNLDFKWSTSDNNFFIFVKVLHGSSSDRSLEKFLKAHNGDIIVLKLVNGYSYLPELVSNLENSIDELKKFTGNTDAFQNKKDFDLELQKIYELLSLGEGPIKEKLQSLRTASLNF